MDIKTTLLASLRKLAQQHTEETLGDRSDYLGASEIGYCPRKVILEKINPSEHDLTSLLYFERGHMAEDIMEDIMGPGSGHAKQLIWWRNIDLLPV